MNRIGFLVSSARQVALADGTHLPAANLSVRDLLGPYERLTSAGVDVIVVTPDGQPPTFAACGPSWLLECPEEDSAYLASVVRTFADNVEDIRVTQQQCSDLGLMAARGTDTLLQTRGLTARQARDAICAAAKVAWSAHRPLADVLAEVRSLAVTIEQAQEVVEAQQTDCHRLAESRKAELRAIPGFQQPVALRSMTAADVDRFDALFVAGGYGAMSDLADCSDVGRLLIALHRNGRPIALVGHGPAALLSAPERPDGTWLFDGYRMTSITDDEEDQTDAGRAGLAWRLDVALKNAGAVFDDGPSAWVSHVVVDRNLITGQNPASTEAVAGALLRTLGVPIPAQGAPPRRSPAETTPPRMRAGPEPVRDFLDAIANRDADAAMSLVDARASVTVHPLEVARAGTESLRQVVVDLLRGFPDLRVDVERIVTTGDVVTALFRMGGTQAAEYAGAIPLNRHLDIRHAWRFVLAGGLITEVSAYWCQAQLYRRLAVKRYDEIAIA